MRISTDSNAGSREGIGGLWVRSEIGDADEVPGECARAVRDADDVAAARAAIAAVGADVSAPINRAGRAGIVGKSCTR